MFPFQTALIHLPWRFVPRLLPFMDRQKLEDATLGQLALVMKTALGRNTAEEILYWVRRKGGTTADANVKRLMTFMG